MRVVTRQERWIQIILLASVGSSISIYWTQQDDVESIVIHTKLIKTLSDLRLAG